MIEAIRNIGILGDILLEKKKNHKKISQHHDWWR
ncbi:hypothetical protein ES708_09628 [subsurface metagenome]